MGAVENKQEGPPCSFRRGENVGKGMNVQRLTDANNSRHIHGACAHAPGEF